MRSTSVGARHPQSQCLSKRRELERRVEHGGLAIEVFRKLGVASRVALAAAVTSRMQDAPPPAAHAFN